MTASLAACSSESMTMQEVFDAYRLESMLKDHESVYIRHTVGGQVILENYLNAEYSYESAGTETVYMTDQACYSCEDEVYRRVVFIEPDGVYDMARYRADRYAYPILSQDSLDEEIQSVTKKDGRITVTSVVSERTVQALAAMTEGLSSCRFEYVIDEKTQTPIVTKGSYGYEDGTVTEVVAECVYDAEMPERVKPFLAYDHQTENLRTVTIVFHSGTESKKTVSVQVAKGLAVGLSVAPGSTGSVGVYTDAACTEPFVDSGEYLSDMTIHVKWTE